jgi:hypothetical protein
MALISSTQADITIKSNVQNEGIGGLMNMEGTQTFMVSGDRAKTASALKMTNKVVSFLGGGKPQELADITRLDKELSWHLDMKEKKYTEMTFAELKAMFEKGLAEAQIKKEEAKDSVNLSANITVENTGKSQTIAGYKADEVIINMVFTGKDEETGKSSGMNMKMDLWVSKDVPGYQEYRHFNQLLVEKLGFAGQGQGSMDQTLKGFGVDPKVIYDKMKGVEGMPLMTVVTMIPEGIDTIALQKSIDSAKAAQPSEEEVKTEEEPSAPKEKALKKLGGLFGKKKDKEKEASKDSESKQKSPYLFHMTSTVTEISGASIAPSEFDVPAGFKKKAE